ncbi:GNAT family N-acetyltransferase [Granulosicoccus sp.]|nr:GNAT family N-acetyltransferase [Granulosicoccus sp.]MDB4224809.1 GNAT family N-acetyltransferase [Granulosicoccus sp.]
MTDIQVRQATESDASGFLGLWDALDTETEFMFFEPNERNETLESQKSKLARSTDSNHVRVLVLDVLGENVLAGFCAGRRSSAFRDQHSLHVFIGIRELYTGKGWGERLLIELEDWAKSKDVIRLELSVMVTNKRAIKLYKNMGFKVEGTKKNAVLLHSGYVDEYIMAKLI